MFSRLKGELHCVYLRLVVLVRFDIVRLAVVLSAILRNYLRQYNCSENVYAL